MENHQEEHQREGVTKRFCSGPPIPGHQIHYDEGGHAWIIDEVLLLCSVAEYRCLNALLASVDRCVPFAELLTCLNTTGSDTKQERMRLAHIMSSLRVRLWPLGFDIGSVMNIGYILLSTRAGSFRTRTDPALMGSAEKKEPCHESSK